MFISAVIFRHALQESEDSMKKLLFLMLFSLNANANCYTDATGFIYCEPIQTYQAPPIIDFRNDYNSPKVYEGGRYRGNLNNNQYDPNSISNPYGKYGSQYSPYSINNHYRVR